MRKKFKITSQSQNAYKVYDIFQWSRVHSYIAMSSVVSVSKVELDPILDIFWYIVLKCIDTIIAKAN